MRKVDSRQAQVHHFEDLNRTDSRPFSSYRQRHIACFAPYKVLDNLYGLTVCSQELKCRPQAHGTKSHSAEGLRG
jgi:hypothetical protein